MLWDLGAIETNVVGNRRYDDFKFPLKNYFILFQNEGLEIASNISADTKLHFRHLLLISHYYALRCACRQATSLKSTGVKISTALLRYTDIIPADKAYYEAGK